LSTVAVYYEVCGNVDEESVEAVFAALVVVVVVVVVVAVAMVVRFTTND
jgi:hypothetical protein